MINVCNNCKRLNPLESENCHYCQANCQAIESGVLGQFMLKRVENKGKKGGAKIMELETMFKEYPDLRIFEDYYNQGSEEELIIAKP